MRSFKKEMGGEREGAGRKKRYQFALFGVYLAWDIPRNIICWGHVYISLSILLGTWRIMGQKMGYCRRLSVKIHIVLRLKTHT
jgi:hypothetical protein